MFRFFFTFVVVAPLTLGTSARAQDKAQIKKDFDAWYAKTTAKFEDNWTKITAAEAAVAPLVDQGIKLAEAGKTKKAIKTLLTARAKLFNGPNGHLNHVNKGLSFKIAASLAEQYEKLKDETRLKREITFMDMGRPWLSKDKEQKVFLYHAIKEVYRVWGVEENKSGKRMKTKERKRLHRIMSYVVVGTSDVIFQEGYQQGKEWEAAAEEAKATYAEDEYEDYGGQGGVTDHLDVHRATNFKKGDLVLVINRKITKASGSRAVIDLTEARTVPVNCKSTGKVFDITPQGRYIYKQKCDFKKKSGGHKVLLQGPRGLKLRRGDIVTMYAKVTKVNARRSEVKVDKVAVVHSSRKGRTQWLLGVKTKKPAHIEPDGDYRVIVRDDAEAPPQVK